MPIVDVGVTENELLEALASEYRQQFRQPEEFSVAEFLAQVGSGTIDSARDFLEGKVQAGELAKRENVILGKSRGTVYRRPSSPPE